ncbi:MAG TPA: neuraminidase-like domain-containing protein, partial [Candidatus Tectomicrobia bacterium]
MATLIVIRLHPIEPLDDGNDFTAYLNGLRIQAFDLGLNSPAGVPIGEAQYLAPPPPPPPVVFDPSDPNPNTRIVQHFAPSGGLPIPVPQAAATAVIEVNLPANHPEHNSYDIRLEITRGGGEIVHRQVYFNVPTDPRLLPPPSQDWQEDPDRPTSLHLVTSLHLALPPSGSERNTADAFVDLPSDGTPPSYDDLRGAVLQVLSGDPDNFPNPPTDADLQDLAPQLTPEKCRHLAFEIVWNRKFYPLPEPPDDFTLAQLYTGARDDDEDVEIARRKFEAALTSYYAIHNAQAETLARFVYALAAAFICTARSQNAARVGFWFPVDPADIGPSERIKEAVVVLTGQGVPPTLAPPFTVLPEYFYALGSRLPTTVTPEQRYTLSTLEDEQILRRELRDAIAAGIITANGAVNDAQAAGRVAQAARRLRALGSTTTTSPDFVVVPGSAVQALVQAWLNHDGEESIVFWRGAIPPPPNPADPAAHLELVLWALTTGHQSLINAIRALPVNSVAALQALTDAQWRGLFGAGGVINVALLPSFTQPGSAEERVAAFIRHLRRFFSIVPSPGGPGPLSAEAPPHLGRSSQDPLLAFINTYNSLSAGPDFTFGVNWNEADFQSALDAVFSADPAARAWLEHLLRTIQALYMLADVGQSDELRFSITEELSAGGFTNQQSVRRLSLENFQAALTGTVAYDHAAAIYNNASGQTPPGGPSRGGGQPINPNGTLTNCIPPPHLAPLGPVAYLHDMLQVSEGSTCTEPFPIDVAQTLADVLAERRGPLGDLHVTWANLETPLPLIDIVNECLEAITADLPTPTAGIVYNTASDALGGHQLQPYGPGTGSAAGALRHKPVTLFEALPEHSTPATPVAQPAAYDTLKSDFSTPLLPYSQPLDISRTYLRHLRTSRYAVLRRFCKDITEFVLDPENEPNEFQRHLWRYPVRIEIAREYLGITPEEYERLFTHDIVAIPTPERLLLRELYGFDADIVDGQSWVEIVGRLDEFLRRTGLTYCEFLALWQAAFVRFRRAGADPAFPDCEPCCLPEYQIQFEDPESPPAALTRLAVFIRLWRKLQSVDGAHYAFAQLRDICEVLQLLHTDGSINADFIRQLTAFQMLRDHFRLALADDTDTQPGTTGADRTHLLALWVGDTARKWVWAVDHLLDRIQYHAQVWYTCGCRPPEFVKLLAANLDPLSRLAGFDLTRDTDTWHARPTHTLRFAEVLEKIYASAFGVGEIFFLCTADDHVGGDDPFPLQSPNEAMDSPLDLPDDEEAYSLWALRRKLLEVEVSDAEVSAWTWTRIEASLRDEFGFAPPMGGPDPLRTLGEHFFPSVLEASGSTVAIPARQYRVALAATAVLMWNTPPDGPFRYDTSTQQLWTQLPLTDEAVLAKLSRIRQLNNLEQEAVRELYFLPRVDLTPFAYLFADFAQADVCLIQEPDETKRWEYFQREFARFYARCQVIAAHLAGHVAAATGQASADGAGLAWCILRSLCADENRATTSWESDTGQVPDVTWNSQPNGGAFAALLGLTGTGLPGEFTPEGSPLIWREVRGPMEAFGAEENAWNSPIATLIPSMSLTFTHDQERFARVRNGFALSNPDGVMLGGAQGFNVRWSGVLLVEHEGEYEFRAGAPTPTGEAPDFEAVQRHHWRITLNRGQKTWIVLSHQWPDEQAPAACAAPMLLKRGAYHLTVEFVQPQPAFDGPEDTCPHTTGFQLKYAGPDSADQLVAIPLDKLFRDRQDATLGEQIDREGAARRFLELHYTSTLRDMRRTYQRSFKALLFAHRFDLSAQPIADDGQSEIGYMLAHQDDFTGRSYFRVPGAFTVHRAHFNFNFLPLQDQYFSPTSAQDRRVNPLVRRQQALFDWWERVFDYTTARQETHTAPERPLWLLFHEAAEAHPDDPAHLLRHMGVDLRHAALVLHYYEAQNLPIYAVSSADLEDERWAIRAWQGEKWIRVLLSRFAIQDIRAARPDLWASEDPSLVEGGETQSGNENLTKFVRDGCIENGDPRRYVDIKRLNDGLRERGRQALLAYLCGMQRVLLPWGGFATQPKHLSEFLLLDIEAGLCQKASRIEEAISAVQIYIQRSRLGLEADWSLSPEFLLLWDRRFATFHIWEACKRREVYRENWIDWDELQQARHTEAFRFLESELRRTTLTVAVPGGLEYWPGQRPPVHPGLTLLQAREPALMQQLARPPEGLNLLGMPERQARLSWLATLPEARDTPLDSPEAEAPRATAGLPFWLQAAIRLGVRFLRIAAAGEPPASTAFAPHPPDSEQGCCADCGKPHPPVIDEYYFWLLDSRYYEGTVQEAAWGATAENSQSDWHRPDRLPQLLHWPSAPMVHLAWCRLHNGEFQQPRRSFEGARVQDNSALELQFDGRAGDSLTFTVRGGQLPPPTPDPGFRYDLATDSAVVLPLLVAPPVPALGTYPAGLPAYPYFAYFAPGAPLVPPSLFSPAIAVAGWLRAHCRFEVALKWYELVFNPLQEDARWCPGDHNDESPIAMFSPEGDNVVCCQSAPVSDDVARQRSITLHYLETLLQWGDVVMRHNAPEAFQQARLIFDTVAQILGRPPRTVLVTDPGGTPQTVAFFVPYAAPLNPRLLALYELVADRLALIHACLNARRLRNGRSNTDMPYWGNRATPHSVQPATPFCHGGELPTHPCPDEEDCCCPDHPYRFLFLVQKAQELANEVRGLGAALLAALEKGDAEYLAALRATHERQLLNLALEIRQNQWREADWQVQALQKTKAISQTRRRYYALLIQNGLNSGEIDYETLSAASMNFRITGNVSDAIAQVFSMVPDLFVGFPVSFTQLPVGTKLAGVFSTAARILNMLAEMSNTNASMRLTQAGWARREEEWRHQVEVLDIEIEQIERQILAAERRRDIALRELNNHQRQIEHATEVHDFL